MLFILKAIHVLLSILVYSVCILWCLDRIFCRYLLCLFDIWCQLIQIFFCLFFAQVTWLMEKVGFEITCSLRIDVKLFHFTLSPHLLYLDNYISKWWKHMWGIQRQSYFSYLSISLSNLYYYYEQRYTNMRKLKNSIICNENIVKHCIVELYSRCTSPWSSALRVNLIWAVLDLGLHWIMSFKQDRNVDLSKQTGATIKDFSSQESHLSRLGINKIVYKAIKNGSLEIYPFPEISFALQHASKSCYKR